MKARRSFDLRGYRFRWDPLFAARAEHCGIVWRHRLELNVVEYAQPFSPESSTRLRIAGRAPT